jgi:rod shape-determining protein MreD
MARALMPREAGLGDRLVPFLSSLCFVLVSVVPLQIPGFAAVTPSFALMAVFHWTSYRPDLLPLTAVFVLGLLLDLLNGTPYLGVAALTLLLARTAVLNGRRYFVGQPFAVLWLGFLAVAAGAFAFDWAFVSLLDGTVLGTRPFIFEAALTVACYPVGSYILVRLHRAFIRTASP